MTDPDRRPHLPPRHRMQFPAFDGTAPFIPLPVTTPVPQWGDIPGTRDRDQTLLTAVALTVRDATTSDLTDPASQQETVDRLQVIATNTDPDTGIGVLLEPLGVMYNAYRRLPTSHRSGAMLLSQPAPRGPLQHHVTSTFLHAGHDHDYWHFTAKQWGPHAHQIDVLAWAIVCLLIHVTSHPHPTHTPQVTAWVNEYLPLAP